MTPISALLGNGILAHHIHLLRLIQRSIMDQNGGDIGLTLDGIGVRHNEFGLELIKRARGKYPDTIQAATLGELRSALVVVAHKIDQVEFHPCDWFPHGWKDSMEWVKARSPRLVKS
jgi:hypothetical protein